MLIQLPVHVGKKNLLWKSALHILNKLYDRLKNWKSDTESHNDPHDIFKEAVESYVARETSRDAIYIHEWSAWLCKQTMMRPTYHRSVYTVHAIIWIGVTSLSVNLLQTRTSKTHFYIVMCHIDYHCDGLVVPATDSGDWCYDSKAHK